MAMTGRDQKIVERIRFLRRRFRTGKRMFSGSPAFIPLVNVALLLLLFLLANSSFVLQPGVIVHLPTSSFTAGVPYGARVVTITQEGMVFFDDERTTLDGLQSSFAQIAFEQPDTPLIIEADGRVRHSTIVRVYNMAMSVGIRRVLLATRLASGSAGAVP